MKRTQVGHVRLHTLLSVLVILALLAPKVVFAEDPKLDSKAQQIAPTAFAADKPTPVLHWGEG
ncbi:MAG: DUF3943 domain-containing protein, partial [Desulfuromonadales bacterium]|nr:DUF3943 domain-containing protein [Desulfuromonadales bacterium]